MTKVKYSEIPVVLTSPSSSKKQAPPDVKQERIRKYLNEKKASTASKSQACRQLFSKTAGAVSSANSDSKLSSSEILKQLAEGLKQRLNFSPNDEQTPMQNQENNAQDNTSRALNSCSL